jgi:hypothetical protein
MSFLQNQFGFLPTAEGAEEVEDEEEDANFAAAAGERGENRVARGRAVGVAGDWRRWPPAAPSSSLASSSSPPLSRLRSWREPSES